jgi:hypothetical protein
MPPTGKECVERLDLRILFSQSDVSYISNGCEVLGNRFEEG